MTVIANFLGFLIRNAVVLFLVYPFFSIPVYLWGRFIGALQVSALTRRVSLVLLILSGAMALTLFFSVKGWLPPAIAQFLYSGAERADTFLGAQLASAGLKGALLKYVVIIFLGWVVLSPVYIGLVLWGQRGSFTLRPRRFNKARARAGNDHLFLGFSVGNRAPYYIPNPIRAEHMLVLGSTGTGKTSSVLEPAIKSDIETGKGLIFMTGKEEPELTARLYAYAVAAGRKAEVQLFSLSDQAGSDSYNPLVYGDETALRDLLLEAFSWDNPYYRDQAKSALLYVFTALIGTGKRFTLKDLYYSFSERACLEHLAAMETDPEIQHHLNSYCRDWKTFRENMRGLAANLEDYTARRLASRLCVAQAGIDLREAYEKQRIVIFVLNSLKYGETARRLGKMIIQNIRFLAGKVAEEGSRHFFPVYIDEFHHFVYPEFFSMVAQCRSANIGLTLSTQSFSDLRGDGWDISTQVVQNTNTKLILRQNDAENAEFAAKLAGTQPVDSVTEQVEKKWLLGRIPTGLGSVRTAEEFVIHPNLIRTLPTGQAAVIIRGHADVLQLGQVKGPETYFDVSELQREPVAGNDHQESLDLYGRWRAGQDEKPGIRSAKISGPKGLDAIRADLERNDGSD